MSFRIVVIDDHPVVAEGVAQLLSGEPDIRIAGRAHDAANGVELVTELRPDAVILDLRLGEGSGAGTCRMLRHCSPGSRVLMHTAFADFEALHACLGWGASGVVFKDGHHLVDAVRAVLHGKTYIDPRLSDAERPRRVPAASGELVVEQLSPREYDLLCAFALGRSTREVAVELHLTENTVRSYTKSLLAKLRSTSRLQALATARRVGLLP